MVSLPNLRHTNLLLQMCDEFDLTDPYRTIYPNRKDYSFLPRSNMQTNRSRIDFFLISNTLFLHTTSCEISQTLQSSLFDNKAIYLSFAEPKNITIKKPSISGSIIKEPNLDIVVFCDTYVSHLHHLDRNIVNRETINLKLETICRIKYLLRPASTPPPPPTFSLTTKYRLK